MRALFVDDEVEFLELMQKRLTKRGITLSVATNGQEALDILESTPKEEFFQIVVMDVRMPGMDGLETLRRMKDKYPDLPIILLTGHVSMGVAVEGMELGAFDYMLKPVSLSELLLKMEEATKVVE
ncbi:MAG: response regulator [Desulfovibrionaceae bacterium]|nr:response regulator [Desulfovibrionaceae bacterium]